MGVEQEEVVRELLRRATGRQQDVDGMVGLMSEDIVWELPIRSRKLIGREACRAEIARQNARAGGILPESQIRNIVSNDRVVFTERVDVFEMAGQKVHLPVSGIFEVEHGMIAAWRDYFDVAAVALQFGVDVSAIIE